MRPRAHASTVLLLASLATSSLAHAQSPMSWPRSAFAAGARVRLLLRPAARFLVGTITRARGDTVVVDTTDTRAEHRLFLPAAIVVDEYRTVDVPVGAVARLEVSAGRSRLGGAWRVGKHTAVSAALIGAVYGLSRPGPFRAGPVVRGFAAGAAVGFTLGAPVGFTRGAERWTSVPLGSTAR